MKNLIYIFIFVLFFSSCKKEKKNYSVTYKVIETSNTTPSYTIRYTLRNGTTQSVSSIVSNSWSSGALSDYDAGAYLNLQIEGSGGGKYEMYILVNGAPDVNRIADDSNGTQSLETSLPN